MNELGRHTSTDGKLTLLVQVGADGETAIGFENGNWHTHPDLLADILQVPEHQSVAEFSPVIFTLDRMNTNENAASSFASVANGFCTWCEGSTLGPKPEQIAASWLSRLYTAALLLPSVEAENSDGQPDLPETEVTKARGNLACFNSWYYREYFDPDPTLNDEPVMGNVGDDLLDTYKDIKTGCVLFKQGKPNEALWYWEFLYRVHWGRHAVGALFAVHCLSVSKQ